MIICGLRDLIVIVNVIEFTVTTALRHATSLMQLGKCSYAEVRSVELEYETYRNTETVPADVFRPLDITLTRACLHCLDEYVPNYSFRYVMMEKE